MAAYSLKMQSIHRQVISSQLKNNLTSEMGLRYADFQLIWLAFSISALSLGVKITPAIFYKRWDRMSSQKDCTMMAFGIGGQKQR